MEYMVALAPLPFAEENTQRSKRHASTRPTQRKIPGKSKTLFFTTKVKTHWRRTQAASDPAGYLEQLVGDVTVKICSFRLI